MNTTTATANTVKLSHENMSQKELEKSLIKSMAGNFRVTFRFAETFAPNADYQYRDRYHESAREYTFIIEETEDKISIQHLLFVDENTIIKHWRQDWIYENRELLKYTKNQEWLKIQLTEEQAKGTWSQKVYQVDDSPRYEGYGRWIHRDGRHYWDSTTDAPLPRREHTKRSDYNVLTRNSRIEIFDNGNWQMEQDNLKILRQDHQADQLICMEKGLETLTLEEYDSSAGKTWWAAHEAYWAVVRQCWEDYIAQNDRIKVNTKINDQILMMALYNLSEEFAAPKPFDATKARTAIANIMSVHAEHFQS